MESREGLNVARKVLAFLRKRRADVVLEEGCARAMGRKGVPLRDMKVDVMVTLGGDGTILRALQRTGSKILGINIGVLGFLTELKVGDFEGGLDKLLKGKFEVERRNKIKVLVDGRRLVDCANEAVINTAQVGKMRHFGVHIDGQMASDVRADGVIVATSTGSTCYSMSVGGPILDPRVDAIVIAPIAPFKLAARPMVVPAGSRIKVELIEPRSCVLVLDGQDEVELKGDEVLELTTSENVAEFIRFGDNFYKRIREKLGG